jgi:hypothetical protein
VVRVVLANHHFAVVLAGVAVQRVVLAVPTRRDRLVLAVLLVTTSLVILLLLGL